MSKINIDIDEEQQFYYLTGDIDELINKRRAILYLKDYLKVNITKDEKIAVPYSPEDQEVILQDIHRLLIKFNIEKYDSSNVKNVLHGYFIEDSNFQIFSKQAKAIRDNQLNDYLINKFAEFTDCLFKRLPTSKLYPLQLLSAFHLAFSQNACNFSVPGSGKTTIVFGAYSYLNSLQKDNPKYVEKLLIIGPLSSFGPWETEYEECFGNSPNSKRLSGGISKEERINHFYSSNPAELSLISYQGVPTMNDEIDYFLNKFPVMVVLDEAHKIKNAEGGLLANSVLKFSKKCRSRVVLTGTPAPNGYEDLFNLFKFIWPTKNIIQYHTYQLKEMSSLPKDPRVNNLIHNVSPYFIRIKKSDLKIPEPIDHEPIIVEMNSVQSEIYNFIEQKYMEYFISNTNQIDIHGIFAKARLIRLMQASTNPYLLRKPLDEYFLEQDITNETFIDDSEIMEKILAYKEIETPQKFIALGKLLQKLLNTDNKVIVWTIYIQNIYDLKDYLLSIGIPSKELFGSTPIEKDETSEEIETRESIIRDFHKLDSPFKVLIANPFAVSESISLHKACHHAVYLERNFNAGQFIQSKDRIHRYGLKPEEETHYYYLLSNNNIDLTIHERLKVKEERMMKIIESEQIPLFQRLGEDFDEEDDIKTLIHNYVTKSTKVQ